MSDKKKTSGLSCGIVGLPNVGKSTLFNALTKQAIPSENFPFCTIDPNIGIVPLIDVRLDTLSKMSKSKQTIYAPVSFVDIAGLVQGASKGEGLGNQFLTTIRQTDAIVEVIRCFEDEDVVHVDGFVDPIHDVEVIHLELVLADLQLVEKALIKLKKQAKGNKEISLKIEVLEKALKHLNENLPLKTLNLGKEEADVLSTYDLLTTKKILYIANVAESDLPEMTNPFVERLKEFAEKEESLVVPICAKLEEELSQLQEKEAREYLQELGLKQSGLQRLITAAFDLLGLVTFITTGEMETKAWTICKGTCASKAAGTIHTDLEKGFIRAEVVSYEDLVHFGSKIKAKEAGKLRFEGRNYIIQDGDVVLFHHN